MPALDFLFLGIALGLSAGLSPGPLLAIVISETLLKGKREGIKVALAPLLTDLPIIAAAIFLVNVFSLNFLFLAGGIYLIYLGIENLRTKSVHTSVKLGISSAWFKGFAANITNPHPYMFWLSVGAPLVVQGIREGALPPAAFLLGFYLCLAGSKVALAVFVDRTRNLFETKRYFYIIKFLGAVLIFMGLFLIKKYFLWGRA